MLFDQIPRYQAYHESVDLQPVRATCFHPRGEVYIVGTNSRSLKVCMYPDYEELQNFAYDDHPEEPNVLYTFYKFHCGSIYCTAFNDTGDLLASGSNDRMIHIIRFNAHKNLPEGNENKLTIHSGTVRDLCFMKESRLISAGAGKNEIRLTDCIKMKLQRTFRGHEDTVMSVHSWEDSNTFVSASLDGTIRLWDTRSDQSAIINKSNGIGAESSEATAKTPVGVVRVEESGKLLVSGHKDGSCILYDLRARRRIQVLKVHQDEVRTLNFSPKSHYLLTASYDHKVKLMDLQGDLTRRLPSVDIAQLNDKVIQTAWHPNEYTFTTTCADGTASLWAMPKVAAGEAESVTGVECKTSIVMGD